MQATERFEAIYPTVKEVALAGSHGSKAMRQAALQMFAFAIKAAGEGMLLHLTTFCSLHPFPPALPAPFLYPLCSY